MKYKKLVKQIAIRTWQDEDNVRRTLRVFGELIAQLKDGEMVITPMGTFRGYFRHPKQVRLPDGTWTEAGPQMQVKFRAGTLLKTDLSE